MTIKKTLIMTSILLCSCGKHETPSVNQSAVSEIHASGNFTFLIKDTGKPLEKGSGNGEDANNELWLKNDATGEKRLLVACKDDEKMENEICNIENPQFSTDKTKVFFESAAWATSGAIHVVDLKTGKEKFVCPGNGLQVVDSGKYMGDIVTNMHKYNEAGSYDHFFIVNDEGKEQVDLGEDVDENKLK